MELEQEERTRAAAANVLDIFCGRHPRGFRALAEAIRDDFWFRDPFVEVHGMDGFMGLLKEGAEHRTDTQWLVSGWSVDGLKAYVRWQFVAAYKNGISLTTDGMTELAFDEEGKLAHQIDFWDSAEAIAVQHPELGTRISEIKKDMPV